MTAYAAAGLANTDAYRAGWTAFYFGILAYIIPCLFVFSPVLLGQGGLGAVTAATVTALIGILGIGIAVQGYFFGRCRVLECTNILVEGTLRRWRMPPAAG